MRTGMSHAVAMSCISRLFWHWLPDMKIEEMTWPDLFIAETIWCVWRAMNSIVA